MNFLKNKYFFISASLLILYIIPWIVLGQNSYILIHDNLDSNVVWFKTLAESGKIFASTSAIIDSFMNAPRGSFGSEFNFILWLYYFFDPYTAYVINQILMRIIAFIGMYLLLDRYILKEENKKYTFLLSGLYSILPFWPSGGLSVAGLPLITYVFLNIKNNVDSKKDWIILILFPFYSNFVFSMMFYIIFIGIIWLFEIYKKRVNKKFTIALFLFVVLYLLVNYRLVEVFLFGSGFISHRIEFKADYYNFFTAIKRTIKLFIIGQYHAYSLQTFFLPFVVIVFFINLFSKSKDKLLIGLFILNIFISLLYGFEKYEGLKTIKEHIYLLKELHLRFYCLTPLIWFVLFALSIKYVIKNYNYKYNIYIIDFIIFLSILWSFYKSDIIQEYKNNHITYKQFFAQNLFEKIDEFIDKNKDNYRVVSIGIHPSIARYNGFYTIDGYFSNYSLKYKHRFRKIILPEFKYKWIKKGIDNWGNRCYVFINDIGYNFVRKKDAVYPIQIEINSTALEQMGGKYIFSSYKIKNVKENNLTFLKKFTDKNSAWDIYLYKVN